MAEPTESEILQRAKELCADDGYAWNEAGEPLDTEDGDNIVLPRQTYAAFDSEVRALLNSNPKSAFRYGILGLRHEMRYNLYLLALRQLWIMHNITPSPSL